MSKLSQRDRKRWAFEAGVARRTTAPCSMLLQRLHPCIAPKVVQLTQLLAAFGAKQPLTPPEIQRNATNRARSWSPACKPQALQIN